MTYAYDAMSRRLSATNLAIQSAPLQQQACTPGRLLASLTTAQTKTVFSTATSTPDGFDRRISDFEDGIYYSLYCRFAMHWPWR
jgi:hypothetical protein